MSSTIQPAGGTQSDFNKLRKDQTYLFVDRSFQDSIIEYFQFLRREAILCDVTLRIGSQKFFCHRSILGVASPYFRSLFIDSESGRFIKNVDLPPEIDGVTMEALLGYMYGGKIFIDTTNVLDIFKGASFFKLHSLLEECSFLLVKFLTPENCLEVREVSLVYGQEKLHQRCQRYLCDHFPAIANAAQFLELPQDELGKILISNALFVTSEKEVFDSLVRWTEHDRKERGIHFTRLLQLVRLPLLPTSALMEHIETAELVQRSPSAKEMVMEAMRFNAFSESQKISLPQNPRTVPRTCSTLVDVILFVGGKGRSVEEGRVTFCYEPVGDRWYTLASLQTPLYDHSLTVVNGLVYACGGSIEGRASLLLQDIVQCYDPDLDYWDFVAPLQEARAKGTASRLRDLLFVCGGMINGSQGNSFEVYNPITDKWKFLSPPVIPRSRHTMVSTETHIYVIGGEGHGFEPEISMERYDPAVDLWSFVLPMNCGKVGACAVELKGKIYVMGGNNGYTTLRQCEIYDVETHQWTLTKDMLEFRQDAQALVLDNRIYVIGGRDFKGERGLDSIECFDVAQREWNRVTSIPVAREGFKCVTCKVSRNHLAQMKVRQSGGNDKISEL
ncbi:kelch-like protein 3 [Acropora millepora]|uniref:kelch-like protein 3 n=1 Tax=Acropora millepora TaxID=45264 RepID=UPI001CF1B670|nr:kelch-like protein 3 [Acropora millepora]